MRRRIACVALALTSFATASAFAGQGLNFAWNDCGAAGDHLKAFACNSNVGIDNLYCSYQTDAAPHGASGVNFIVDLQSESTTLPAWWEVGSQIVDPPLCRRLSLGANADFVNGPFTCYDPFQGTAVGGISSYRIGYGGDNRARIVGSFAVPSTDPAPLEEGVEVFAFRLLISHGKTVGTSGCTGCEVPVCLVVTQLVVKFGSGLPDRVISGPLLSDFVMWHDSPQLCTTPTRNRTWGAIKSLYR
jgi:hypothetical protein